MVRPRYLKKGDKVAIVATAKRLNENEIDGAIREIESWGLEVICGPNLYAVYHQFAGTDEQRASDLQWAIDHEEISAVIFARGGYGTARIIDSIDWEIFQSNPKWLCGFSDLTVLHSHVNQHLKIETLHSTIPIFFKDGMANAGSESLRKTLFGLNETMIWDAHLLNRTGTADGEIVGGNLSVLYSIMSTPSQMDFNGKILFLEDLTENLYHIDRMIRQLKRSGALSDLKGLVVGQFTEMVDNSTPFGKSAEEIIFEAVSEWTYPLAFDAPIGHVVENISAIHGANAELKVLEDKILIRYM
jgi:muramoyltetrapeptide carboxypeptidase